MNSKYNWSNLISWFIARPKTSGVFVSFILTILVCLVVFQRYQIAKENKQHEMQNILIGVHQNIEQSLKNCYTTTLTLALTIDDDGEPQNFESIGAQLLESNNSIASVQLVPNGIIKYIFPIEGNAAALGLNILESKLHRKEALQSVRNEKMYFAGPFELKQGGTGIVGRLPVYQKNNFWGFSAVIIKLETLLKSAGIDAIDKSKYYFQFSKNNPNTLKDEFFLPIEEDFLQKNHVSKLIPDGNWEIYLIAKNSNDIYSQLIVPAILGLILALFFGILTHLIVKKPAELQLLVNEQTDKLFSSEMKFKTIFDQASLGIAHVDSFSGNFIAVNKKYHDLLGYSLEEIKNKNFQSITHADDLEEDLMNLEKLRNGEIREYSMEKRHFTKSGEVIWVQLTVSAIWKPNEKATTHIAIIEDISLKKEAEENLNQSLDLVNEQNERLLNFSYIVSHNLRSHTSNISSIMSLIETAETEDERNEMIQLLRSVSNSLNETMLHLNEVISIRNNSGLVSEPLDLKLYIDSAKNILTEQINANDVDLNIDVPSDTTVNYNPAYLESILYNLLSNSIRYRHPDRKPVVSIEYATESKKKVLKISDNGIGIDLVKYADKIFGMYKTFTSNPESKGIGLFITKNQIEAMGGSITVESEPNIGTTFKIYM